MSERDSGRGPVMTIDLAAVAANWRRLATIASPAVCAAVVKADAYGLGVESVAPALAAAGCRLLYVAHLDEGITLRAVLPGPEIAIFHGVASGTEETFAHHRLIPVLNSLDEIERWSALARKTRSRPGILHIDTGLNRLGLSASEVAALAARPDLLAGIDVRTIISHLACADEPDNAMNAAQLRALRERAHSLPCSRLGLAASSGIFLGPAFHLDEVRPGAALYGVAPQPGEPNPMRPVASLHAPILQVHDVDTLMTVGYGAGHTVRRPSRIATVGVGYADGLSRALSNKGRAFIGDFPAPLAGRVSMDLTTLDVTDVPAELVHPGGLVEFLGPRRSIDELAIDAGTIGYEVLTSLGNAQRVRRRYLRGEAA
jgi:alanine racemase